MGTASLRNYLFSEPRVIPRPAKTDKYLGIDGMATDYENGRSAISGRIFNPASSARSALLLYTPFKNTRGLQCKTYTIRSNAWGHCHLLAFCLSFFAKKAKFESIDPMAAAKKYTKVPVLRRLGSAVRCMFSRGDNAENENSMEKAMSRASRLKFMCEILLRLSC